MKKYITLALALLILLSLFTVHGYEGTLYVESSAFTDMDDAVTIAKRKEIRMVGDVTWKSGIRDFYAAVFSLDGGGGTLKIESDISINAGCNIVFKNVLLDLGGKHFITVGAGGNVTLGSGAKVSGGAGSHGGAFSLGGEGASLTMQEGSGITGSNAKTAAAVAVGKGASLNLLGGTVTGNTSTDEAGGAIRAIKGSCVVLGGKANVTGNLSAGKESNIVITDADILRVREDYKGSAGITLSGGNEETKRFGQLDGETAGNRLFSDQDKTLTAVIARDGSLVWGDTAKANTSDTGKKSESSPSNEKLYEQTKNLTADDEKAASGGKAFKVGKNYYDDLLQAVNDAGGKTVYLIADSEWNDAVKDFYQTALNIDGNGFELKLPGVIYINRGSSLTLSNVTVDLGGKCLKAMGTGHITLDKGAVLKNGGADFAGALSAEGNGCTVTMKPGSIITGAKGKIGAGIATLTGANIELLGGVIENGTADSGGAVYIASGSKVTIGGDFTLRNNKSGGAEGGIEIADSGALTVTGEFTGSAGIKIPGAADSKIGTETGGAKGTEKIYAIGTDLVVTTDGKGGLVLGKSGQSKVSSSSGKTGESKTEEKAASGGKAFKVGSKTYDDLGSAVNDAGGAKITMVADGEWTGDLKDFYGMNIIIDGGGHTLKLDSVKYINRGSSLTLSNITVDLGGKCLKAMGTGHITLDKGAVLKNGGADFAGALSAEGNGCTVTMKPGSIITGAKGKIGAGIATLTGANIELLGGVIENGTADSGGAVYIASGSKVTIGGDFTLRNNKSGGAEGGIEIADSGALTVTGEFTGSAGIKIPGAADSKIGTETGGAKGTEKIYAIGTDLVVTTDGKGGLVLGKSGQSKVSDKSSITEEKEKEENTESIYYTDKSGWTASANTVAPGREASKAIDGNYSTCWHTEYGWEDNMVTWKTPLPHNLDIDFKEPLDISGFTLITNPTAPAGQPTKMQFFVKIDGEYKLVKEYKYNITSESYSQTIENKFNAAVRAEGVRLLYIDALDGHGTLAEIEIMKPEEGMKSEPFDEFLATMGKNEFYPIPMSGATASYDGLNWSRTVPGNVLDGSISTSWQADPSEKPPYNLVIDMGDVYTVNGFRYTTRQTKWFDGYWEKFNIWISDNGKDYTLLKENETFLPRTLATQDRLFGSEVTTRFFKFEILAGTGNLASLAEIEFLEDFDSYMERRKEEEQYYTLKAGSKEMILKDGKKELSGAPYIENGTTFIPLRGLLEEMGASVEWNDYDRSVNIKKGNTEICLQIRNKNVYVTSVKSGKERYTLASAPRITDSLTYIPLRFVSEMLGYTVEWNAETGEINIKN